MKLNCLLFPRLVLLVLVLFSFSQCKKTDSAPVQETLPTATQVGKNTLGFMLNGRVWNARIEPHHPPTSVTNSSYYKGTFSISANRILGDSVDQHFVLYNGTVINKLGTYKLGFIRDDKIGAVLNNYTSDGTDYYTISDNSSWITITKLDTISRPKIISGTFNIDLYDNDRNKIEIREGRFDVNMP